MRTVEIELGYDLYEISIDDFSPPGKMPRGAARLKYPQDPGEISLGKTVKATPYNHEFEDTTEISMADFLVIYADYLGRGTTVPQAREHLEQYCFDDIMQQLEDEWEEDR